MGLTGTGKSSFIRLLTNSDVTISHSLAACTAEVGVYSFETSGGHLVTLIDTPGFDDTHRSDTEILQDVAYFLSEVYSQELKLAGIIYLHRIFDTKMGGSALRNLNMFQALCGETGMSHVVLATTMWDKLQSVEAFEEGERKEAELRSDYWADMLKFGSQTFRHNNTRDCALRIINHILSLSGKAVLKIQREMIDDKCRLDQTQAGQQLQKELLEQNAKHERQLQQAQQYHEAA
ncbi:P-loop containing nucleoside triphosphate hydrolase protein, partial [Thelonectria olida]